MKKLIVCLLFFVSCKPSETVRKEIVTSNNQPGVAVETPTGTVVLADAPQPASYTFLDTPDANLCVDAFNRQGIALPPETVARTINVRNVRVGGISVQDMGSSTVPVLNIVRLENNCSDTTFQFLNPNGFYCVVKNNAVYSNITIQRRCSAPLAELEPMTHVTVNEPSFSCGFLGWKCWGKGLDGQGSQTSYNSQIIETPCIP